MPTATETVPTTKPTQLLVCLPALSPESLQQTLATLTAAFPNETLLLASPNDAPDLIPYPTPRPESSWILTAGDYAAAASLSAQHPDATVLLLGEATTLTPDTLHHLVHCIRSQSIDLALPRYNMGPSEGLVNAALLYPLTRAIFATDIRFPLTDIAALSPRMATRLATVAQRHIAVGQPASLLWPVAEAAIAGFSVRQVPAGNAHPPRPNDVPFNDLFATIASSLFADVEAKATFWQRARTPLITAPAEITTAPAPTAELLGELEPMLASFRLAHTNLQEIWSLVLPPQTRLALKRLSQQPAESFSLDPALWARIVYDFTLAFHLRTLNRGHLLGAMTPLYLAWAASHLRAVGEDPTLAAQSIDATAHAFDREKPYIVQRWRWPDRFNP
jgi:hypothetical protein